MGPLQTLTLGQVVEVTSGQVVTISKHRDPPLRVTVLTVGSVPYIQMGFPSWAVPLLLILLLCPSEDSGSICSVTPFGWWKVQLYPLSSGLKPHLLLSHPRQCVAWAQWSQ